MLALLDAFLCFGNLQPLSTGKKLRSGPNRHHEKIDKKPVDKKKIQKRLKKNSRISNCQIIFFRFREKKISLEIFHVKC